MKFRALVAVALMVVASTAPVGAAVTGNAQSGGASAATFVSFETQSNAIVDYTVSGETVVDSVAVQSTQKAQSGSGGLGVDVALEAVTNFAAADLSIQTSFQASANAEAVITTSSGAEIHVNDNDRGILVISAGSQSQYVRANLTAGSSAEQISENRVVVENGDGTTGVFLVVGEGEVAVNEAGNVSAKLQQNAKLVYRQYTGERSESEKQQEQLIVSGKAVAEVYYQQAQQSGDEGTQRIANVVTYGQDVTVEVTQKSANELTMTVERSQSQGKVVIVSLSEQAFQTAEDVQVVVDGETAVQVESYSAVQSAANGGENCAYLVRSSSSAQASTDVVIGINHFSAREVSIQSDDSGNGSDGDGDGADTGGQPGFGILAALAALGAGLLASYRRSL